MKKFVLVTATKTEQSGAECSSSGIRKLKRGVNLDEFITEYLEPIDFTDSDTERYTRSGTTTIVASFSFKVMTFSFTEYSEDDLMSAVSHLTREEMLRDLKELLPLKSQQ